MTINDELDRIFTARDRNNMPPTIDALLPLYASHPENARVLYEVGGAYDTAGQEETAHGFHENALAAGLEGDLLRRDTPAIHFASAPARRRQAAKAAIAVVHVWSEAPALTAMRSAPANPAWPNTSWYWRVPALSGLTLNGRRHDRSPRYFVNEDRVKDLLAARLHYLQGG